MKITTSSFNFSLVSSVPKPFKVSSFVICAKIFGGASVVNLYAALNNDLERLSFYFGISFALISNSVD